MAYFVLAGFRSESCQPEVLPSIEVSRKLDLENAAIRTKEHNKAGRGVVRKAQEDLVG